MDYQIPTLKDHLDLIQAARRKMLRTTQYLYAAEWFGVAIIVCIGWSVYTIYSHWAETIISLDATVKVALSGIAVAMLCIPTILTLFCAFWRDTLKRNVTLCEMRIDIAVSVHTAIREFFGLALPQYATHFKGFGLAEELLTISSQMSVHAERAHHVTTQALKILEEYGGIQGIRHETLKASVLAEFMQGFLEVLSQHKDVLAAAEVDEELEEQVRKLAEQLMVAE